MDNNIVLQGLTESFEIIKDSWETKKEAIINCIVETEKYDGDLAMDMWLYILNKEGEHICKDGSKFVFFGNNDKMEECIGNVFKAFFYKYEEYESPSLMCKVLFEHIVPHIIKKDKLLEILFDGSDNMGYCTEIFETLYSNRQYKNEFIPALIGCIFLLDNPIVSLKIIDYMINCSNLCSWSYHKDSAISVGKLIRISKEYIQSVYNNKEDFDKEYVITNRVKEALLSSLDKIEDAENRAEFTIEILSL